MKTTKKIDTGIGLTIPERFSLDNDIRPKEGNFATLIITKDIHEKIKITQEELKKYDITFNYSPDGRCFMFGNEKIDKDKKNINFTDMEKSTILAELKKLDEQKKLQESHINICKLFGFEG